MLVLTSGDHFIKVFIDENSGISSVQKQRLTGDAHGTAEQEGA